jgi:hypothetical protein
VETPEGRCPHLLFYMNGHAGVLDRVAPSIEDKRELIEEADDWHEWAGLLPSTAVVFCLVVPDRGPLVGNVSSYCINFTAGGETQ